MSRPAVAQMNIRIDSSLKASGDAALAAAGFTPSRAVRALWALAEKWKSEPERIRQVLTPENPIEKDARTVSRLAAIEAGENIVALTYARLGLETPPAIPALSDDELKELSFKDRGLL